MSYYTIFIARETFFSQEIEADSENDIWVGNYRVISERQRSTTPDEVIRVNEPEEGEEVKNDDGN